MATEAGPGTSTKQATRIPRQRPETTPDIRPRAGHELLLGIDAVLARLAEPGAATGLADDLRTALARIAATGDNCRVRPQADGVRTAADLLLAGSVDEARPVLQRVRAELADHRRP